MENDAIDQWNKVKNSSQDFQSRCHLLFFHERYQTLDYHALKNLRLYELRKANYEKLYAERVSVILLEFSIFVLILWFIIKHWY